MSVNVDFDYENEESIDNNLKCSICNEPFVNPVTTSCHHPFCRPCLEEWFNTDKLTCPTCRQIISRNSTIPITLLSFISMLDQILVKCKLCDQCNIQRGNFQDHIDKVCSKTIVRCTANGIVCPWRGLREELQTHLSTCTCEPLRSQLEQNNGEDQQKVDLPVNGVTRNCRPVFRQGNINDRVIFTHVNPELQDVSEQEIATATREIIINGQCTHLNLFSHKISPENILVIASALPNNTSLKSLELGKCSLTDFGVRFLAPTLAMYGCVECLDLYDNSITDIGVQYLASMLQINRSLSQLKLAYNKISNKGVKIFANEIVNQNLKLKHLSLMGNKLIDDSCIYSIFYIIKCNQSLKILNLEHCNISWYSQKSIQLSQTLYNHTDLEILL